MIVQRICTYFIWLTLFIYCPYAVKLTQAFQFFVCLFLKSLNYYVVWREINKYSFMCHKFSLAFLLTFFNNWSLTRPLFPLLIVFWFLPPRENDNFKYFSFMKLSAVFMYKWWTKCCHWVGQQKTNQWQCRNRSCYIWQRKARLSTAMEKISQINLVTLSFYSVNVGAAL